MRLLVVLAGLVWVAGCASVDNGPATSAPDEIALGKSEGYPVCNSPAERCLVGLYSHYDQVFQAHKVAKGATVRPLHRAAKESAAADFKTYLATNRITGVLVLKGDTILFERYQYDRTPEHRFTSMSMAKSVVAMLVGIALRDGRIKSIDDRADQYLEGLKGHPYGETPLRHLLTMSSGVKFSEEYDGGDDITALFRATVNWQRGGVAAVLPFKQRIRAPGRVFAYASAETHVLGLVLRAAVGVPLVEYLSEKIWQPMGAEADATWLVDVDGNELGYMGIQATLRDWARFGMLLANGGTLDGKEIIPASWVKAATHPEAPHLRPGTATGSVGYGYQTWIVPGWRQTFVLRGVRGQSVFVDPAAKLVLVQTSVYASERHPSTANQFSLWQALLRTYAN